MKHSPARLFTIALTTAFSAAALSSRALSLAVIWGLTCSPAARSAEGYLLDGKPISEAEYKAANLVQESMKVLEQGNVAQALAKAQEAYNLAPNLYYALSALGICQARSGKTTEAVANLRKALVVKPDQPDALWSLGATLQSAGKSEEAIVVLKQFVAKYPNNPRTQQGRSLVNLLERQLKMNSRITTHSDEDYFAEAVGVRAMRWADDKIPIKIYIAPATNVTGYQPEYGAALIDAMHSWEEASQGKVRFQVIDNPAQASITFKWSSDPKDVSQPAEGGEARLIPAGNTLNSARVVVLTAKTMPGIKLTPQVIRFVCIHELGHAIGIGGHSQSPSDIMYSSLPLNFEQLKLSERDARTVRRLYSTNLGTINDASARAPVNLADQASIKEAADLSLFNERATVAMQTQDYDEAVNILQQGLQKFPQSDVLKRNLAAALNNTGLKALNGKDFDKAIAIFEQALTLNPLSKPARNNIAIVHYNKGLDASNKNDMTLAETELKLAVEQLEGANNPTLLNKAANNYAFVLKKMGKDSDARVIQSKYKVTGI